LFGMMAAKPIPQEIVEAWTDPGLADVRIRRDVLKYARTTFDKSDLVRATNRLSDFDGDVLVLWTRNRVMPAAHAEALAQLTGGTLRFVDDAKVLIMRDQPEETARAIADFLTD
jgi:pimeloyl-ACP methyl ester carboxylesterase